MVKYSSLGGMAQLVEHSLHMRGVTGSSPVVSTNRYPSASVTFRLARMGLFLLFIGANIFFLLLRIYLTLAIIF